MRKLRVSIILIVATILMLMPVQPVQPVQAMGFYEEFYIVRYHGVCGPSCEVFIEGEWTRDCNGNMTGWGAKPGDPYTFTETTLGNECMAP